MFGLGRRRNDEVRRLQAQGQALSQQLEQAQQGLQEANKRAEKAEFQASFLASQNRALVAKVQRLTLNSLELHDCRERVTRENNELRLEKSRLEEEASVAKAATADAAQVPNLKAALQHQAAQHEKKISSFKKRTKALLAAMLPVTHGQRAVGHAPPSPRSAPSSPSAEIASHDLWDVPLSPPPLVDQDKMDLHGRVRDILVCLYDDTLSEDQALEEITALTQDLVQIGPTKGLSRGCSPLHLSATESTSTGTEDAGTSTEKVDASTDMLTSRARFMSDAATETPVELSYLGTPHDIAATPSEAPASPKRAVPGGVPALDLAALVAQVLEEAPHSGRSTASTSTGPTGTSTFNAFSQFVLAQPEKLQRLVMRHAVATAANPSKQWAQPSYGSSLLPASAAVGPFDIPLAGSTSLDPISVAGGPSATRPAFPLTSRLFGFGGSSVGNRVNTAAAPSATSSNTASNNTGTAGVVLPATSGANASPAKGSKRMGNTAPKFVKLDTSGSAQPRPEVPKLVLPGAHFLASQDKTSGVNVAQAIPSISGGFDNDLHDFQAGGGSALTVIRPGLADR